MKKIAIIAGGAFGKAVFEELEKRNFEPVLFAGGGEKLSDFISESGALAAVVSPNFKLPSENKSAPQIIKGRVRLHLRGGFRSRGDRPI